MTAQAASWAFKQHIQNSGAKFVLVALSEYVDHNGECNPDLPSLADLVGQTEPSVRLNLVWLADRGFIEIFPRWTEDHVRKGDMILLRMDDAEARP